MTKTPDEPRARVWMLVDGSSEHGPREVVVHEGEFLVGRSPENHLVLNVGSISKVHARIEARPDGLCVHDLGSTNGTYVNGLRTAGEMELRERDIVRFGSVNFRVAVRGSRLQNTVDTSKFDPHWISPLEEELLLERLIQDRAVDIHVQPVVALAPHATVGFEALARPRLEGLTRDAAELFALAARAERAGTVSALCRDLAVADQDCRMLLADSLRASSNDQAFLFSNLHNDELDSDELPLQVSSIRRELGNATLVLEISERSILDHSKVGRRLEPLRDAGAWIAFDDFGAGHDRLLQLASHPPEILKFDRQLIQSLRPENQKIRTLLRGLVETAKGLGCWAVAEGVETAEQAELCAEIGFDLVQGYYFGRPAPANMIRLDELGKPG